VAAALDGISRHSVTEGGKTIRRHLALRNNSLWLATLSDRVPNIADVALCGGGPCYATGQHRCIRLSLTSTTAGAWRAELVLIAGFMSVRGPACPVFAVDQSQQVRARFTAE
jgi:hypothetical protein